jgi:hypothetical protein
VNPRWLQRQTRVLLSWREQALRAATGQPADAAGYSAADALAQARTAQERLDVLRAEAQRHIDALSSRVQRLSDQQSALIERVQSGALSPAKANRQNQRISSRMAALRAEIGACRHVVAADTSEALGGLLRAPLRRYCTLSMQPSYLRWSTMDTVDRRTLIGTLLVVFVLVIGIGAYLRKEATLTFEAFLVDRATAEILVRCTNATPAPVTFGLGDELEVQRQYTVTLSVQGEDGSFQPLGGIERTREDDAVRAEEASAVTVAPGLFHDHRLFLRPMLPPSSTTQTVRVECSGPDGRVLHSQDIRL